MLGSLVNVPTPGSQGLIAGDNGAEYSFTQAALRNSLTPMSPGTRVEFQARGMRAVDVRPEAANVTAQALPPVPGGATPPVPVPNPGGGGQPPPKQAIAPLNNGRQQPPQGRGSMRAAMRSMLMIFLLTPVAIPLLLLLPLIGRLEVLLMAMAPGFLGGMKAGSLRGAIASALLVGTAYFSVHYLLSLSLFRFLAGLPEVGRYVEALVEFSGGFWTATALVTVTMTLPFLVALFVSAFLGAVAGRMARRK